jgi:tetratricopeptide (TPR) repeat protein
MQPRVPSFVHAPVALALALGAAAGSAFAAGTEPPRPTPPPPAEAPAAMPAKADSTPAPAGHAAAEKVYAQGWEFSEDAKKDLGSGNAGSAKKKFGKALKKFDEATQMDAQYFQAWNMVGYCARRTGDLKRSFAAYAKCLEIQPEFPQAHEYLGEAYLMGGDLAKAKEQLAWLRSRQAPDADVLAPKIDAFMKGGWKEVEKLSEAKKDSVPGW